MSTKTRHVKGAARDRHERLDRARTFWERWQGTKEGKLFVAGLVGVALVLAELGIVYLLRPAMGLGLLQMVLTENFAGREGAIPLAIAGGAPWWLAAQVSALQDLVVVALAYPAFLHVLRRYHERDNLVMRRLRKLEAAAATHRKVADRWGGIGIYVFMVIPFLVNGPLIGAVAGKLAGLRTQVIAIPVVLATCTAALAWSVAYDSLYGFVSRYDDRLPLLLTGIILAIIVLLMFVGELRDARREKRENAGKDFGT